MKKVSAGLDIVSNTFKAVKGKIDDVIERVKCGDEFIQSAGSSKTLKVI